MPIKLIVNADDFGYSPEVNAAVEIAHKEGVLTSASLMVTGDAVGEAVQIAKRNPKLAVGLHLVLSHARSALSPESIPDLVNANSMFEANPVKASLKYIFNKKTRAQLEREIEAQFEAFMKHGIALSHVDGHQHMHAIPGVFLIVMKMAERYRARGIRVPRDPVFLNLAVDHSHSISKMGVGLGHAYQSRMCWRLLNNSGLARTDFCIGSLMTGNMSDAYVIGMLEKIKAGSVEVYFHPCMVDSSEKLGPNAGDLKTLLSPALKEYVSEHCSLLTYPQLREDEAR